MNVQPSYDALWQKRLAALEKVWPDFLNGETEALHKVRVASRRIREALPVVAAAAPPSKVRKLRRRLRELTRFLGPIRELDVELMMVEREAVSDQVPATALTLVRREIAAQRQELRARLAEEKPVGDIKKLRRKLQKIAGVDQPHAKAKKLVARESAWRAALGASLLRRAKRLTAALEEAGPLYVPERLHDVRIATKKLRYALEIAEEAGHAAARPLLKTLKKEQRRLGALHDRHALLKHVRAAEASPRGGTRLGELTAYADGLERECRTIHAAFVEDRGLLLTVADDVRRSLVPALTTEKMKARPAKTTRLSSGAQAASSAPKTGKRRS